MNPVAIVGGGITGLSAAFRLREQNIPVVLYEAGGRVGGAIQTIRENGFVSEYGPGAILETSPKITELISDLGLNPRRCDASGAAQKNYIVRGGRMISLPGSAAALAATRLFSAAGKLRIAAEPFVRTPPASEDESVADFVVRRLGREFLDYAINPFVSGVYAGDPTKLSLRHAFAKLHAVEARYGSLIVGQYLGAWERCRRKEVSRPRAPKVSFDEGLQLLPDALLERLGDVVKLHSPVCALKKEEGSWTVTVRSGTGGEQRRHSALLLTAPAHQLAGIPLHGAGEDSLEPLGGIEHPAVARIVLGFRREDVADPLNGFGFLVPAAERMRILGTTFSSSLFANRAPAGHVLLTTFVGGSRNPELAGRDAGELMELVLQDLRRVLGVRGRPVYCHHALFPAAIPQYNVGFGKFMEWFAAMEGRHEGLFFAGSYRNGVSVGNSIIAGQEAAGSIAEFFHGGASRKHREREAGC